MTNSSKTRKDATYQLQIPKAVVKNNSNGNKPIYLQIKIDGDDVQIKQDQTKNVQNMFNQKDANMYLESPSKCPMHSCRNSNHERSYQHHQTFLGKRNRSSMYNNTPTQMQQNMFAGRHFDEMTCQTQPSKKNTNSGCYNHSANMKNGVNENYGQFLDDTLISSFEDVSK